MKRNELMRQIAEAAYNVGYGAKLHFATMDITDKVPGLLGFIGIVVGVFALVHDELATKNIGAVMTILGVIAVYIAPYQGDRDRYDQTGKELTVLFNGLKTLYFEAKSLEQDADVTSLLSQFKTLESKTIGLSVSKQILCSDWYAHYKFFRQMEIGWINEARPFKLISDKIPLTATLSAGAVALAALIIFTHPELLNLLVCAKGDKQ